MYFRRVLIFLVHMLINVTVNNGFPLNNEQANTFWRKYFCTDWSNTPWGKGSNSFKTDRIVQNRTLIGSCNVDIGTCPMGSCSTNKVTTFFHCPENGYICPHTETRTQDCGTYGVRTYEYVVSCGCCKDNGIQVETIVTDSVSNLPLKEIKISVGKQLMGETDNKGIIAFNVPTKTKSAVLKAYDIHSAFMDAVNVLKVPDGLRGPIKVNMMMVRMQDPVQIDTVGVTKISLSKNPSNPEAGNAFVLVDSDSFTDMSGVPYKGPVNASVTFLDPVLDPPASIPGLLLTQVGDTTENLISDGMFTIGFKGEKGINIASGALKVTVRKGMRLWNLDLKTGLWEPAKVRQGRQKRQTSLTEEFTIDIANRQWINIDTIAQAPKCFFKTKIFNEDTGAEISYSKTTFFKPEIVGLTSLNQRYRMYADSTKRPRNTCFEVRCPDGNSPLEAKLGFISMFSSEMVIIGGDNVPYSMGLKPFDISLYGATRSTLETVKYKVDTKNMNVRVDLKSSANGPFYTDKTVCEKSSVDGPSFNFYKPRPPKYDAEPETTDFCSARIAFVDDYNFYNYTAGMKTLPKITSISVWENFEKRSIYKDEAVIEDSTLGGDYFLSACVKYRCSRPDEPTIVYLDIDIPNIISSFLQPDNNDTHIENQKFSVQAFVCEGKCDGPLCKYQYKVGNDATIEGSFEASIKDRGTPTVNDCALNLHESVKFDYHFMCFSREGYPSEKGARLKQISLVNDMLLKDVNSSSVR